MLLPRAPLELTEQTDGKIKIFIMTAYLKIHQGYLLCTLIGLFHTKYKQTLVTEHKRKQKKCDLWKL